MKLIILKDKIQYLEILYKLNYSITCCTFTFTDNKLEAIIDQFYTKISI